MAIYSNLKSLKALIAVAALMPSILENYVKIVPVIETTTIVKSNIFHESLKYLIPNAINLRRALIVKTKVNAVFIQSMIFLNF